MEYKTIRSVKAGHFIVPLGVKTALVNWGIPAERISEIGWGETIELDGMKITAVEGIHFSGRGLTDRNRTLWNSYVIRTHWRAYDMGWHAWDKSINRIVEKAGGKPFELMTPLIGEKLIPGVTPTTFWWQQK